MRSRTTFFASLAALATTVAGQPLNYGGEATEVRVGVLLTDSQRAANGFQTNAAPHVWYALDRDITVKPARWSFVNPGAPSVLSAAAQRRWASFDAGTPGPGSAVSKASAPYWEVELGALDERSLARYDVLSLTVDRKLSFTSGERERLRRFIDQGGVLWVDLVNTLGVSYDEANPLPFPFAVATSLGDVDGDLLHPLLRSPNALTLSDLNTMGYPLMGRPHFVTTTMPYGIGGGFDKMMRWVANDSRRLQIVAGTDAARGVVSLGKIGQGYLVVTTRGVTLTLNRGRVPGSPGSTSPNQGYRSLVPAVDPASVAAAKLAVNIVSIVGSSPGPGAGPRKTNSNSVDLGAPLLRRFEAFDGGPLAPGQPPAVASGRIVVTRGNELLCLDARPDRDLDGNGDPDDGLEDTFGSGYDLIWRAVVPGSRLSPPVIVESPDSVVANPSRGNIVSTQQVWVANDQSRVFVFDLESAGANQAALENWPPIAQIQPPANTQVSASGPFAPTVHESIAIVTDTASGGVLGTSGRVWAIDIARAQLLRTQNDFALLRSPRFGEPSGGATVGYIAIQDSSGGLDRVVYVPTAPNPTASRAAGVVSIWLGARGEVPFRRELNGPLFTVQTRASLQGLPVLVDPRQYQTAAPFTLDSLGLKVTVVRNNGVPLDLSEMQQLFADVVETNPGVLQFTVANSLGLDLTGQETPGDPTDDVSVRLDYTIDWGRAGEGFGQPQYDNFIRGNLGFPDNSNFARRVIGDLALAPTGNLIALTADPQQPRGGSVFNLKEDRGPGNFSLVSRFDLYQAFTFTVNSGGAGDSLSVPSAVTDEDTINLLLPFLRGNFTNWGFAGGPTVRGGTVYVSAVADKGIFNNAFQARTGVLLAFKADPPVVSFEIEGQDSNFSIVQPDIALSAQVTQPEQFSNLNPGQFTVEPIPGTTRSRVVLPSLMATTRNQMRDSLNTSAPVIIRRGGQTDVVVEPEAGTDNGRFIAGRANGRWSPLLWYVVFNGYESYTPPVVAGETLFQAGSSVLPYFVRNGFVPGEPPVPSGLVWAMDARISPNDEFLALNSVRPWHQQYRTFKVQDVNNPRFEGVRPANAIKWPQFRGIASGDDFRIRILQVATNEPRVINLAAGDGALAMTGDAGVYGFTRSDFLVVDSGRVSRFDSTGNPVWSTDQTLQQGSSVASGPAAEAVGLSEPSRVYPAGDNGYWIVDTGNHRVVRIDAAGRETRSVTEFKLDPNFRPAGLPDQGAAAGAAAGMNLRLRRPKDVLVYETVVDGTVAGANPFSNPRPLERWLHMVIADSGNSRVVELVDRFEIDRNTGRTIGPVRYDDGSGRLVAALGTLYWHTPEQLSGRDYDYNSIARASRTINGQLSTVVALGFGNAELGRGTLGLDGGQGQWDNPSGNSGVVLYDGARSVVINQFVRPAVPARSYLGETAPGSNEFDFLLPTLDQPERIQKITGLRSVTLRYVNHQNRIVPAVMIAEATGVYELVQNLNRPGEWTARWMLPVEAYVGMRRPRESGPYTRGQLRNNPTSLRPMYARRLDSGDVLVVNGHVGRRFDGNTFNGEIVLLDGSFGGDGNDPGFQIGRPNLGFNFLSVKYELPPVQGARDILAPVFAQRQ
jgi:hypothetical protein